MARELREGTFDLAVTRGPQSARSAGAPRSLAAPDVRARVIHRALLDELRSAAALAPVFENPNSFGGIHDRGRAEAVREAFKEIADNKACFLRTGIKDFFPRILQTGTLDRISVHLDEPTAALLFDAVRADRASAAALTALRDELPEEDRGVAQGFGVSSLFANVALTDFDAELNGRGIRCIRYVDELLLLGESERKVMKAFDSALDLLVKLGLQAHDPRTPGDKAAHGRTDRRFDFLGCSLQRGLLRPGHKATRRLVDGVSARLAEGASYLATLGREPDRHNCVSAVLHDVGNIVRDWRKSFDFCEQPFVFGDVDKAVGAKLAWYYGELRRAHDQADEAGRRALLGVPSLVQRSP
jgi:hypothetical protein